MSVSVGILIVGIEKYLQIHTDTSNTYNTFIYCYTYIYLHVHAYTCIYILIHAYTFKYLQIPI